MRHAQLLILLLAALPASAAPPNILLIMEDDPGYSDLCCNNGEIRDLAASKPQRLQTMQDQLAAWARRVGVVPREMIFEAMKVGAK